MHRWGNRLRTRFLAVCMALLLGLWPSNAVFAHVDPPGAPTLIVVGDGLRLTLTEDEDDGFDFDSELVLLLNGTHHLHGQGTAKFENYSYDEDSGQPWAIAKPNNFWTHVECTPRNELLAAAAVIEIDTSSATSQVVFSVSSALAGAAVGAMYGSAGGPVGTILGGLAGLGVSLLPLLNGDDDLGVGAVAVPANGAALIQTRGADGGTNIVVFGATGTINDTQCSTPQPVTDLTPRQRADLVFPYLEAAMAQAGEITVEPGNPAALTEAQVADIRLTLVRMAVGVGGMVTGAEIELARGYAGVDRAIEHYLSGLELAAEDPAAALEAFESAFVVAATARAQGEADSEAPLLPFHVVMTPDYLATREGRSPTVVAAAMGATGPVEFSVSGLPAGAAAELEAVAPGFPAYTIAFNLSAVAPGTYPIAVSATGDGQEAARTFTVVVNPAPPPGADGVTVPGETSSGTTVAVVDNARDQAFSDAAGNMRMKLPAGTIAGPEGRVAVTQLTGSALEEIVSQVSLPDGARPLMAVSVEARTVDGDSEFPVGAFGATASLRLATPDGTDPNRVSLLQPRAGAPATILAGRPMDGDIRYPLSQPGLYILAEVQPTFSDLENHWARVDVERMAAKGIIRGVAPQLFDPAGLVNRAQFAALLVRAMGLPLTDQPVSFSDVSPSDWFYREVATAYHAGLIQGMGDGSFAPNAPVTREQVGVMLARALIASGQAVTLDGDRVDLLLAPFADQDQVSSWARAGLAQAIQDAIMRGQSVDRLAPQANTSRAEAAVMIGRFWQW